MSFNAGPNLNQNPYLNQKGNEYLKQYHKNQIETASPEQILIMLYDGAIQFLNKAKVALAKRDITAVHNNIVSCENIILEFMNTLDMEIGGDLAKTLYALYEFLYHTLVKANIKHDEEKIDLVLKHLKGLRETWQQAIELAGKEKLAGNSTSDEKKNVVYKVGDDSDNDDEDDDDEYEEEDDDEE